MKRNIPVLFVLSFLPTPIAARDFVTLWRLDEPGDLDGNEIKLYWRYDDDEGREVAIVSFDVASPSPGIDELSPGLHAGRERGWSVLEKSDMLIDIAGREPRCLAERLDPGLPGGTEKFTGYMDLDNFNGTLHSFLFVDPLDPAIGWTGKELDGLIGQE
ncbi:MAG: hypothetical protein NT080_06585 [Spirochaetes bacterium]|nr:hypothetical protein [Spirochaetota bacterium]